MLRESTGLVTTKAAKISHPDYEDFYIVDDGKDCLIDSVLYTKYPFTFSPIEDEKEGKLSAKIRLSNSTRTFVAMLRTVMDSVTITVMTVSITDPSTDPTSGLIEIELFPMDVDDIKIEDSYIDLNLSFGLGEGNRFPNRTYNPSDFPGMF